MSKRGNAWKAAPLPEYEGHRYVPGTVTSGPDGVGSTAHYEGPDGNQVIISDLPSGVTVQEARVSAMQTGNPL